MVEVGSSNEPGAESSISQGRLQGLPLHSCPVGCGRVVLIRTYPWVWAGAIPVVLLWPAYCVYKKNGGEPGAWRVAGNLPLSKNSLSYPAAIPERDLVSYVGYPGAASQHAASADF